MGMGILNEILLIKEDLQPYVHIFGFMVLLQLWWFKGKELSFAERGNYIFGGRTDTVRKSGQAVIVSILLKGHFIRKTALFIAVSAFLKIFSLLVSLSSRRLVFSVELDVSS